MTETIQAPRKVGSRIVRLNHTTLGCADPYRTAMFYTAVFNSDLASEVTHNHTFLGVPVCESVMLDCFGVEGYGSLTLEQTHPHHAFEVDAEDVMWWIQQLEYWGVPFAARARPRSGSLALYFRDPDGHHLEIMCPSCPADLFGRLPPLPYEEAGTEHATPMNEHWPPPPRADEAKRQFEAKLAAVREQGVG